MRKLREPKKIIRDNWDEFLGAYYHQYCGGCPDGHNSHWKTVIESSQWKAWKATNPPYDFAENEELGIMSPYHFQDFLKFVVGEAPPKERLKQIQEIK